MKRVTVDPNTECWTWIGARNYQNYGTFRIDNSRKLAHRVSYQLFKSDFNPDLYVCHSCDNPPCVNPAHLWMGTAMDNARDRISKGRPGPSNQPTGEKNNHAKLTEPQIKDIVDLYKSGLVASEIAIIYGVEKSTICRITSGKGWRKVTSGVKYDRVAPRVAPHLAAIASKPGILNGRAKITEDDVRNIRLEYAQGGVRQVDLASKYGLAQAVVSMIIRRATWKHVE
jgi:hypothetical protein